MDKSTFSVLYEPLRRKLVDMREKAGFSQRDLAAKLGREHSFVSRIELGERRLDLVELFWVARACGEDPVKVTVDLMREISLVQSKEKHGARKRS